MAERLKNLEQSGESLKPVEHLALPEAKDAEPLRKGEQDPAKALHEARTKVEETTKAETASNPVEDLQRAEKAAKPAQPLHVNRELKSITLNRELTAIRRRLSAPQRVLSKVIHQPAISAVSEPLSKTVSRPSGMLGGGIVAFAGTSAYLYITRHNGGNYSYFVFLGLFLGGFVLGLILELLVFALTAPRRHAND